MSVTTQQAVTLLENILFESSAKASANAASWVAQSAANPATEGSIDGLAAAMTASTEAAVATKVIGYYYSALHRAPGSAEVAYYVALAEQGLTPTQITAGQVSDSTWHSIAGDFTQSQEFMVDAGAQATQIGYLYKITLGRDPSSIEVAYYQQQMANGADVATLFQHFTDSPEFQSYTDPAIMAAMTSYGATVAKGLTPPPTVSIGITIGAPPPPPPPPPVSTPTPTPPAPVHVDFTIGTDNFTSANAADTFSAILGTDATLTVNDSLHGQGNVLTITDITAGHASQDVLPTGASLTAITEIDLTTSGNAGTDAGTTLDLSGVTGLTKIALDSSGTHGDFLNTGSADSVSLTAHGTGDVVNLAGNSLATLTLSGTVTGVTVTDPSGPAGLTVNISGLTLSGGFTDASNHVTSLTVSETGASSTLSAITDSALTSASFTNNGSSPSTPLTVTSAISAPALASLTLNGNVQLSVIGDTVSTGITVSGATDNAQISIIAPGQTASGVTNHITLGDGNNIITLGATPIGAIPGATEADTVTWKALGSAGATETIDVTWEDFAFMSAGSETIGGVTVTSNGSSTFTAAQVAAVAEGGTIAGLSASSTGHWTVNAGSGSNDSILTSTTLNAPASTPSDSSSTGSGASPTFIETVVGSAATGGSESIGGATVTSTANGHYTAAQIATVAAGGSVAGLTLASSPTLWTIGTASGATTKFTSIAANHAESGPTGAGASGTATAPTSVQQTAGVTSVASSGGGGLAGSTDSLTLGGGDNTVTDYTQGTLRLTAGNGNNDILAKGAGATLDIGLGSGSNTVVAAADAAGTITFAAHSAADSVTVTASGSSVANILQITGLNAASTDSIVFGDHATGTATPVTATAVTGAGGDTGSLADWVATADGAAGGGVTGAAHSLVWFQFGGNTYLLESVAGQTADHGVMAAGNTLVELTGTSFTGFSVTAGVVHLAPPTFGTLTTGLDAIDDHGMTGAHTYAASIGGPSETLSAGDSLIGNGSAELDITDNGTGGGVTLPGSLSGISTLTLTTGEDAGLSSSPFNLQLVSGLTSFTFHATGTGGDYLRGAAGIDVMAFTASSVFSILSGAKSLALTDDAITDLTASGTYTNGITLTDAGTTSVTLHLNASSLSFTDSGNHLTTLIVDAASASTISAISDTALTTLETGAGTQNVTFGTSSSAVSLGANVATVDLRTDVSTAAGNFFVVNSDNVAITLGTNNNSIDVNNHTGATITPGVDGAYNGASPTPNLILAHASGTTLMFRQ